MISSSGLPEERLRALGERDVERVVAHHDADGARLRREPLQHRDGAAEIVLRRRQGPEHVLVAAGKNPARRAAALDHRHLVFLGDRRSGEHVIAGIGPEQEIYPVPGDELLLLAHAHVHIRPVVADLERELVFELSDRDAALLVDPVDGELVGVAVVTPGTGEIPGQLQGRPEGDRVALGAGGRAGGRENRRQHFHDHGCHG